MRRKQYAVVGSLGKVKKANKQEARKFARVLRDQFIEETLNEQPLSDEIFAALLKPHNCGFYGSSC